MPEPSPAVPAQLFYSYSHKDERLRDRLEVHLSALKREGLISGWHDRKIGAGKEWKDSIDDHLKAAAIILLLVSADFLASDYCYDIELRYAMERHHKGEARVIPVILQPCDWDTAVFAKLQALPKDAKPVTKWSNRNDAFVNIAAGIRKALKEMTEGIPVSVKSPVTMDKPAAPITSIPTSLNSLHQLPSPPADFTGRAGELQDLREAVKTGGVTISGLQGLGGVGKTALALKLAEQLKPDYPDAQFYLDLKGVSMQPMTPRYAMAHVVRAYHPTAQLPEKEEELAPIFRSVLEGRRALLLMDNARDAKQVAPLIPPAGCLLLVTSRQHFTLPGLVEKNLDKLPAGDARDLLLRIAPRLEKEEPEQVDALTRLCGYLPLALRAVGSALHIAKNISLADCIRNMADRRQRLKLTEADAALQSSYELLKEDLRKKLRFLAVFPDTFDHAAAAAMWDATLESSQDALSDLFAYSLVDFDETTKRYSLHDLVRLFTGQLLNDEELYTVQKRHAGHYLQVLATADQLYLKGSESVTQGLALFDVEWINIQVGQKWVAARQQDDDAIAKWCWQYPHAGINCLMLRQQPREFILWLVPALRAAAKIKRRDWESYALGNLGLAYNSLGKYRDAIKNYESVLKIARDMADRPSEAKALSNLGNAYHNLHDYRRAVKLHKQSLKIARDIGDRRGESQDLGNLGNVYGSLGEHRRAIEYQEKALAIIRKLGDRLGESQVLGNLGNAYAGLREYRRAIEYYEQQLEISREIGDRMGEANSFWNGALALDHLGNRSEAIAHAEAALKIYEAIESTDAFNARNLLAEWRGEDRTRGKGNAE